MVRMLILFCIAIWSFSLASLGDEQPELPSRDLSVVIPLLKNFSYKDGFLKVLQILGKEDVDTGSAFIDATFKLTDGTFIAVRASANEHSVYSITRYKGSVTSKRGEILYSHTQTITK